MNTTEVTIDGIQYRIGALSALEQFHILRRLAPLLAHVRTMTATLDVVRRVKAMQAEGQESAQEEQTAETFAAILAPIMETAATMPQENVDYIILRCLQVCQREVGDRWGPLVAADGLSFMYADMTMSTMLALVKETVTHNMGNFFDLAVSGLL